MARSRNVVTGTYSPVRDKSGQQVVDPERGRKWRITAEMPRRGGKRNRRYRDVYGSERNVNNEMHQFIAELNQDVALNIIPSKIDIDASRVTFGEQVELWLEVNRNNGSIKRRTWEGYFSMAHNHVIPCLGHVLLQDISAYHIAKYRDIKLGDGQNLDGGQLCPGTVNKHLALISNVLEDAASPEKGRLIQYNPGNLVKRARGGRNRKTVIVNCLSLRQLVDLLSKLLLLYMLRGTADPIKRTPEAIGVLKHVGYTDEEIESPKALFRFRAAALFPIVYLAAVTGMRLSELLALKWADIDFETRKIRVYESSHFGRKAFTGGERHHINSTKEGKPKHPIDITEKDAAFLLYHRKDQELKRERYRGMYFNNELVFAKNNGTYLRNDTVSSEFTKFARSINMSVTFHGLRHTHCTLLLPKVPTAYVSRRVGHLVPSTTDDHYIHVEKADELNLGVIFHSILGDGIQLPALEGVSC